MKIDGNVCLGVQQRVRLEDIGQVACVRRAMKQDGWEMRCGGG